MPLRSQLRLIIAHALARLNAREDQPVPIEMLYASDRRTPADLETALTELAQLGIIGTVNRQYFLAADGLKLIKEIRSAG